MPRRAEYVEPGLDLPFKPQHVTKIDLAFPARGDELTPRWKDIPEEFRTESNPWCGLASGLFFGTHKGIELIPAEGINPEAAYLHIRVCLGTFGTKHERKIGGVGLLFSTWFVAARWDYGVTKQDINWPEHLK